MGTRTSQLMNIDEIKDETCHICALTKLTMILADASKRETHPSFETFGEGHSKSPPKNFQND